MSTLQYVGKQVTDNSDLVYKGYVGLVKNSDLSVAQIDDAINGGLAGYATVGYVDSRDARNATKAYVDGLPPGVNPNGGDAGRLALSAKNQPSGSVPLDATGRIPSSRINAPLTQKWVRGPWTPPPNAYPTVPQPITVEQTVYSCPVTDPGYPYKLVVFGHLTNRSSTASEYGIFYVRVGAQAPTGEIIATGYGAQESSDTVVPTQGENFDTPATADLGVNWTNSTISGTGGFYNVSGGQAKWTGGTNRVSRHRRLGPDAKTLTDYQRVRFTVGTRLATNTLFGAQGTNWVCARMNDAETDWVGFGLGVNNFTMVYCLGGVITTMPDNSGGWVTTGSTISTTPSAGTDYDVLCGTSTNLRQFYYFRNNVLIGQAFDGNNVTKADSSHRGWGFGAQEYPASLLLDPAWPADIERLLITDAPPSAHHVSLIPTNLASATVRTGSTTVYVRGVRSGANSTQTVTPFLPRLTIFAVPV